MQYKNHNRFSSILAYEYGPDWITIEFVNGMTRTYKYADSGRKNVEYMKKYADRGEGLGSFIERHKDEFKPEKKKKGWFF